MSPGRETSKWFDASAVDPETKVAGSGDSIRPILRDIPDGATVKSGR
jgi:hypothetical protein